MIANKNYRLIKAIKESCCNNNMGGGGSDKSSAYIQKTLEQLTPEEYVRSRYVSSALEGVTYPKYWVYGVFDATSESISDPYRYYADETPEALANKLMGLPEIKSTVATLYKEIISLDTRFAFIGYSTENPSGLAVVSCNGKVIYDLDGLNNTWLINTDIGEVIIVPLQPE